MMPSAIPGFNPSEDWEAIVRASVDGIIVVDDGGTVLFANHAARSMFADQVADLVGFYLGVPAIRHPVSLVLAQGGDVMFVEMRASEITWQGRSAMLAMLRDVTRRKRTEEALRESLEEREWLLEEARTWLAQLGILEDQREAPDALMESERFARSTLDGLSANIALLEEAGEILLINKAWWWR